MADSASWVARTLAGDKEAFASIYDEFATPIYDFCRSILRDDADAADAAQETFVVAHQKLDTLRDPQKLRPWLYSIARRQSLRRVDQRRRTVAGDELGEMSDETIDLDAGLSEQDAVKLVWDAATGLSPRDRLVLDLHLRHGLAGQDLADSLDVTRQNAYVLLDKMKSALSRAAGALLVARYKRRDCDELEALLADWDGRYSPLVRKRVARHVDSCDVCERNKAALIAPDRLFSLAPLVAAPAALRAGVLEAIGNGANSGGRTGASGRSAQPADQREDSTSRRSTLVKVGVGVTLFIGLLVGAVLARGGGTDNPAVPAPTVTVVPTTAPTTLAPSASTTTAPTATSSTTTTTNGAPTDSTTTTDSAAGSTTTTSATTTSMARWLVPRGQWS